MLEQLTQAYRYYKTICELANLTDEDLYQLDISRSEIVFVAYKAILVNHD